MSRSIKITDEVYQLIRKYQAPRESYSEVIKRMAAGFEALDETRRLFKDFPHLPERPKQEVH